MSSMNNEYLSFAKTLAHKAGDLMLIHFDTNVSQREKEDKTIVTIADEAINQMVIEEVNKTYSNHSILGEEASDQREAEYTWVCDPIDGTIPYSKGLPVSTFSLALVHDGKPMIGVIYDPFMKRLYSAALGEGAFMNDRSIHVSNKVLARHSVIITEWWTEASYDTDTIGRQLSLETKCYALRIGSTVQACSRVAAGFYEACIFPGTRAVDIAAAKVIVEEAGGKVTDRFGNEQRYDQDIKGAIISNGIVHEQLVAAAQRYG